MKPTQNRRSLRNYLLQPDLQLRYVLYFLAFAIVAAVLNQMMLVRVIQSGLLEVLLAGDIEAADVVLGTGRALGEALWRMSALFLVLGLACSLFAIRITHRIVGPHIAFHRHIRALANGEYDAVCRLRVDDHFQDTAEALNELARALQHSKGEHGQGLAA